MGDLLRKLGVKMKFGWLLATVNLATPLAAQGWYEPKRDTAER